MWSFGSLFFFTMASVGFILFMTKYPHGSEIRLWGIRTCHLLGFVGVLMLWLSRGHLTELSLVIASSLIVSVVAFELSVKYLD